MGSWRGERDRRASPEGDAGGLLAPAEQSDLQPGHSCHQANSGLQQSFREVMEARDTALPEPWPGAGHTNRKCGLARVPLSRCPGAAVGFTTTDRAANLSEECAQESGPPTLKNRSPTPARARSASQRPAAEQRSLPFSAGSAEPEETGSPENVGCKARHLHGSRG